MKKNYILPLSALFFMSGCASIVGETVEQKVSFEGGNVRHFEFNKVQGTNEYSIKNALTSSFEKASKVRKVRNYRSDSGTRGKFGLEADFIGKDIKATHYDNFGTLYDEKSAIYQVSIENKKNSYIITVDCPSEFLDRSNKRGGMADDNSIPADLAMQNFNKICKDANPSISSSTWVKGEFNSKYKSEDVFANFTRILSKVNNADVKGFDIEKAEVFKLAIDENNKKTDTNLALSVYPYRGGAKVVYAFKYGYKSDAKGHSSYNESEINKAKQKITDIAND